MSQSVAPKTGDESFGESEGFILKHYGHLVLLLLYLNFFDATMTLTLVRLEIVEEANPLMDYLLSMGGWRFFLYKVTLVGLCCCLLWSRRKLKWVRMCLLGCLGVYVCIAFIHMLIVHSLCCS